MKYARSTPEKNDYERLQMAAVSVVAMDSAASNADAAKRAMQTAFTKQCLAWVDSFVKKDTPPPESLVNLVEFLEWHEEPQLRAGQEEPVLQ